MELDPERLSNGRCRLSPQQVRVRQRREGVRQNLIIQNLLKILLATVILLPSHAWAEVSSVEEKIVEEATAQDIDPNLALAIIKCESGFKQGAINKSSRAGGYWQFLPSTWKDTLTRMGLPQNIDVFDGRANMLAGLWLLKTDGTRHWLASFDCWSRM